MIFLTEHASAEKASEVQAILSKAGIASRVMVDPLSARMSAHAEFCHTGIFVSEGDYKKASALIVPTSTSAKAA
jgi:hypothetical protein